jgi:hypothetical protein
VPTPSEENKNFDLFSLHFFQDLLPKHKTDTPAPIRSKDFSRERRLTLPIVLSLIINMIRPGKRFGYQEVLNRFYSDTGLAHQEGSDQKPPDKAAFCRARQKLPLDVFQELFSSAVTKAEELAAQLGETTWHGFRVLAIDGTKKIMPYSEQLEAFFGIPSGSSFPQMLTCALYDVLAKIPLDVVYGTFAASERTMARLLYKDLNRSDLLLMDRGFPSFEILAEMLSFGFQFMVRLPITGLFKEVRAFLDKGRVDGILTIHPPASLVKELRNQGKPIPAPICLRVVKIKLPDGKKALFVTTLLDKTTYSIAQLRHLYHKRWREEEFYKLTKGLLEAENFRGKCTLLIGQELMAIHLYCLLTRILIMESALSKQVSTDEIPQQAAFLAVSRYLDKIWTCSNLDQCRLLLQMCIVEIGWGKYRPRPGRSFPRKSKSCYGKWGRK